MSRQQRASWCAARSGPKLKSGADYREWKQLLRPMLVSETAPQPLDELLARFRTAGARLHTATTATGRQGMFVTHSCRPAWQPRAPASQPAAGRRPCHRTARVWAVGSTATWPHTTEAVEGRRNELRRSRAHRRGARVRKPYGLQTAARRGAGSGSLRYFARSGSRDLSTRISERRSASGRRRSSKGCRT